MHKKALRLSLCDWLTTESSISSVYCTSELMRRVRQIWRLWIEKLKPKWMAFTPTGWFKRIIWHDWSSSAPPFLISVRQWQLKAEAWWRGVIRTNGTVDTLTGQRTNEEYVALLTYCMMDLSLVKDNTSSDWHCVKCSQGWQVGATCKRRSYFKCFSRQEMTVSWKFSDIHMLHFWFA